MFLKMGIRIELFDNSSVGNRQTEKFWIIGSEL